MSFAVADLPVKRVVPRDGYDRPMIVPKGGGRPVAHTRTTTFVDCIEDKTALHDYGQRNVLIGIARSPAEHYLLAEVRDLDPESPEGKRRLNELVEKFEKLSGADWKRDKGSHLHELSEYVDRGEQLPTATRYGETTDEDVEDMAAYKMATLDMDVSRIEQFVVITELLVAGTADRYVHYAGPGPLLGDRIEGNFVLDLKTGNIEFGQAKIAGQLAAYSHAEFYDFTRIPHFIRDVCKCRTLEHQACWKAWKETEFDAELAASAYSPLPDINQEWGIVVNLRPGSAEATLHWVDLVYGWEVAQQSWRTRNLRSAARRAIRPFV